MKISILILMPFFMGYEKIIQEELIDTYLLHVIDNEQYAGETGKKQRDNILYRVEGKLSKKLAERRFEKLMEKNTDKIVKNLIGSGQKFDFLICVNGHYIPDKVWKVLKRKLSGTQFVLYLWDDVAYLRKIRHMMFFDKVYSYNLDDCHKYNAEYCPMFVKKFDKRSEERRYDIAIICTAHPDKVELVKRIYQQYGKKYKLYIYLYSPTGEKGNFYHTEPLSYDEYLTVLSQSIAIFEIPLFNQKGPTTRLNDALETRTKVITINEKVIDYPVYSKNTLIVNRNNIDIPAEFIAEPYHDECIKAVHTDDWIEKLTGCDRT